MNKIIIILIAGILLACTAMSYCFKKKNKPVAQESRITVTGSARNIRGHAAVVAPSTGVYYVDGLEQWEQDWLNQEVKITGDLFNSNSRLVTSNERSQLRDSTDKIIKAAVVLLLQH